MKKPILFIALLLFTSLQIFAQTNDQVAPKADGEVADENAIVLTGFDADEKMLDELLGAAQSEVLLEDRVNANGKFIPQMVEVLKKPGSFRFPFKKIQNMSTLFAPDSTFKIYTWVLPLCDTLPTAKKSNMMEKYGFRYYGAIQLNTGDEKLKLIPLTDRSTEIFGMGVEEMILTNKDWFGCVYYNITMNEHNGVKYYSLFGWDGNNNLTSTIKIADVLSFDNSGNVVFGAPIFEIKREKLLVVRNRILLQFKKNSGVTLNYNPEKELIIYDFIEPESPEARGNYNLYIPDGTYEALKFEQGYWKYQQRAFDEISSSPMNVQNVKANSTESSNVKKKKKRRKKRK